ncbi:MAG: polyprenyl synthetase family protein [Clostridia bacterium]|nr:polyprenyl synthetase family protein [Clostridia bacterium]
MFKEEFNRKIETVSLALEKYFEKADNYQKTIYDAMAYSLFAGGKRIRPVLALACAELFDSGEKVLPFACSLEMIHTYSLIHDDLPCMDNDDLRRGKPTNHKVYGEAMAVLAGDALLTKAFEISVKFSELSPEQTLREIEVLATAGGTEGMIGGQVIDIESEGKRVDAKTLDALHLNKTGALIIAAAKLGAIAGGASEDDIKNLSEYAKNLGLAFQIKDDILDVEGDSDILGKMTGVDEINEKTTFVSLYGLEKSKQMLDEYTKKAKANLKPYGKKAEFLEELADYLLKRKN